MRLQRAANNHSLHSPLGEQHAPQLCYRLQVSAADMKEKSIFSFWLHLITSSWGDTARKKKLLFSNKGVKSVQVDFSKGDKEHCVFYYRGICLKATL